MKQERKHSSKIVLLVLMLVLLIASLTVVLTSAADEIEVKGEMVAIKEAFDEKYLAQATVRADDEYVGKIQYTAYYDTSKGTIKTGYEGTPVIVYTINHPEIERIGTDSDVEIIQSMLDRGYVVIVLDYLNGSKAVDPEIAKSSQAFRTELRNGVILKASSIFPSGSYHENFLAPAGYNVSLFNVFWEIDKHSAEGTLEKIVENWNSDFRATKGGKLLKWATGDTVDARKAVQKDLDGNAPVWYNASGKVDENGLYTYVKYTKAETITDCVDPDGSFLDMNLYIHIVYPTSPEKEVPVMSLANSSGYPTTSVTGADVRPHSNSFLYQGYANVVFDYLWQPMARNASWGYYDGSQGNTADHMNYGLMMYNDKLVNTAAMRYLRYISLSGGDTYNFDLDKFGVYGNSKGGWFSFLGEKVLQTELVDPTKYDTTEALEEAINAVISDFIPDRYYNGHHGETRYQVGAGVISKDGFTLNAGEKQPWLTYDGKEILSGAQLTNACNGSQEEDITAGHSPIFISGNMTDTYNAAYSYSVNIYNMCRELDIPLLHFEVPIGHTLTSGIDMNYNVDTYVAYFNYVNYYLKSTPISVSHTSPMNNAGNVSVTDKITIYFAGAVTASEIEKVTVSSADGTVSGQWESSFGGTTWTFTPDSLKGATLYTVTVPATLKGDNGVEMGTAYTMSFITEMDTATATVMSGSYHSVSVPAFTNGNSFVFRFFVANDAVNVAELYAVSAKGETSGEYLGSVKVNGAGSYEIDITDFAAKNTGNTVVLYLKCAKAAGENNVFANDPFDTYSKSNTSQVTYEKGATIDGETAFKVAITGPVNKNNISYYYDNVTSVFTYSNIVENSVANTEGKRFVISFDVYDTVSRKLQLKLNTMTNRTGYGTIDYDHIIFTIDTKANEWTHVEFTYDVYETKYGFASDGKTQSLAFMLSPDGDLASPAYFNNLKSVEITTELDVTSAVIAEKNDGTGMPYTPATSASPFAIYNGDTLIGEYATWKATLAAYKSGYTIKLQSDYTFVDADISNALGGFATVNVDLGNYTISSENTKNSLIYAYANNTNNTTVNVTGGAILLNKTPLISYESSTAAGSGKTFNVNLDGTYVGFTDNAYTTMVMSAVSTTAGVSINTNVNLKNCTIDLPDSNHARDAFAVFTNPTATSLKVKYTVTGGKINLTSQRWATVSENANIVEFKKDANGNYTVLVMPKANTYDVSGSYLNEVGFATYAKAYEENNTVTYVLENSANSTKYGIITDTYADASKYPFVVFKDGNLIGGYTDYKTAIDAAATALNGTSFVNSEAQIYVRANFKTDKEVNLGSSAGTIVVDLNDFTMLRDKNPASMVVNSSAIFDYATGLLYKNGRIEMNHSYNSSKDTYSAGLLGATHVLKEVTEVKTFNVTYENITFGFADGYYSSLNSNGLLWSVWQNSYKSETITNLTLNDCVFDFTKNAPTGKNLISASGTYADFNIAINGGEIRGNGSAFSIVVKDAEDNAILGRNSKGEYIKLAEGAVPTTDNFLCDDGVYRSFQATANGYELLENDLMTPYGEVPAANGNNIFVIFSDGKFVSGHDTWASATGAAGTLLDGKTTKKATLLMRKDYTNTGDACNSSALGKCNGELTIDLGGHAFTRAKVVFDFSYQSGNTAPANVIIKNGTLVATGSPIFANQVGEGGTTDNKVWNVTVEGVIITFAEGATKTDETLWASWTNPKKVDGKADLTSVIHGSMTNVTFNDCTFDLTNAADSSTLFDLSDNNSYDLMKTNLTINGGKILSKNLAKLTISSVNSNTSDVITFGKLNGEYITMTTPTTAKDFSHYDKPVNTTEGVRYFIETSDDGATSTYELLPMTFGDFSASITANYMSAVDYPFFVFLGNTFKTANISWSEAIDAAKGHVDSTAEASNVATIIVRRDYNVSKTNTAGTSDEQCNLNSVHGKVVVDLCGNVLNAVDTYILDININYSTTSILGFTSTVEFKNGTIKNSRTSTLPAIGMQHTKNTAADDTKHYVYTFTNVTFAFESAAKLTMIDEFPDKTGDGIITDYIFNNCTVDFTGAAKGTVAFDFKDNKTTMVSNFVFNGGSVIANNLNDYTLVLYNTNDSAVFGKYNDKYTALTQLTASATPTASYKNANGVTLSFGKDGENGIYTTYLLGEPIKTPYGELPFSYQSAELYPFMAFDGDGKFIIASAYLYGPNNEALSVMGRVKEYLKTNVWDGTSYGAAPKTAYIVLRRDYQMASDETFNNLSQVQGVVTIDLNGFTLTTNESKPMFPATVKPWSGSGDLPVFKTQFNVINGEIVVSKSGLIKYGAWDASGNDVTNKQFDFEFTNVKFTATSATANMILTYYVDSQTPDADAWPNLTFNGCTFDLTKAPKGAVIFDLGNGLIHTDVTVNGGEIIANNTNFVMFKKNEMTKSELTFGKEGNGNYVALTLPESISVPTDTYLGVNGEKLNFVKASEADGKVTYTLSSVSLEGYAIKTSITLWSNFVYNIYIPTTSFVGATVNGEAVTYTEVTVDGVDYYHVKVNLPAGKTLSDIKLVVTVNNGVTDVSATWTLNVLNYTKAIMAGEFTAVTKTLMKDMLAYAYAAHTYFENTAEEAEKLLEVENILEGYTKDMPTGEAKKPENKTYFTDVAVYLGEVPSFRFYLATGYNADNFTFTAGGKAKNVTAGTDENGNYLEIVMYAYMMLEDVTYTVIGTDTAETYNLFAYYEYAKEENDAELIAIVEALMKYSASAQAYRNEVIGSNN